MRSEQKITLNQMVKIYNRIKDDLTSYRSMSKFLIGKWVYFDNKYSPSHHGRIESIDGISIEVKCKNAYKRYIKPKDIIEVFNTKKECFKFNPHHTLELIEINVHLMN